MMALENAQDQCLFLNTPSDIEGIYRDTQNSRRGEVKKMLAWWDGVSLQLASSLEDAIALPPKTHIATTVSWKSGLNHEKIILPTSPKVAMWAVAINEGDGYRVIEECRLKTEYDLRLKIEALYGQEWREQNLRPSSSHIPDLHNWFASSKDRLMEFASEIAKSDSSYAEIWRDHLITITEFGGQGLSKDHPLPHSMVVTIEAFLHLKLLSYELTSHFNDVLKLADKKGWAGQLQYYRPLLLKVAQQGHRAGKFAKALETIASNRITLSTLGSQKGRKRSLGKRALFILDQENKLFDLLGRKPAAKQIMKKLNNMIDPQTGQKIWTKTDEDGILVIQWADGCQQTLSQFSTKLSELRKKRK